MLKHRVFQRSLTFFSGRLFALRAYQNRALLAGVAYDWTLFPGKPIGRVTFSASGGRGLGRPTRTACR